MDLTFYLDSNDDIKGIKVEIRIILHDSFKLSNHYLAKIWMKIMVSPQYSKNL